jgi:hypothetical protein
VLVNGAHVSAFEYSSAEAAAADAALVRPDGQPSILSVITWVSTPRFYRQDRLIVLYVGCSTEVVQALDVTVGPAFVISRTPCENSKVMQNSPIHPARARTGGRDIDSITVLFMNLP